MSRLLPVVIAVVAIAALTVVEGLMSERWADSRLCAYCVTLLDTVPSQIGDWTGVDSEVDDETREVAGARGFVSRTYSNPSTGQTVSVWLIVGHARDTADHQPTTCYGGNGFSGGKSKTKHTLTLDDGSEATFFTALFEKNHPLGTHKERVYWTWFKPETDSGKPVQWVAPDNLRLAIGAAPALFKLYFTTQGEAATEPIEENDALDFAREFLPVVAAALADGNAKIPDDFDPSTVPEA